MGKILLRKLRPRGKVYVARSYRKSPGVLGAHFVLCVKGVNERKNRRKSTIEKRRRK